jgi:antirestriction protein ArdC
MSIDIAQLITDRIISELEKGATPWVKPWKRLKGQPGEGMPFNPSSGTVYRGMNHIWLSMMQGAYPAPYWVTFKQAQAMGGMVKAGEKGTPVVYWNVNRKETMGDNGEKVTSAYAFIKHYFVFNVAQCEGLDLSIEAQPEPEPEPASFDQSPAVMALIDRLALKGGLHHGGDSAFFRPSTDSINMPPLAAFNDAGQYHATLLHESIHATGHDSRLKRLTPARFGSEEYAYEELVAELGAAMLCAKLGIDGDLRHAGYIESWLKALRNDKKFIISAAGKAQAALDWLIPVAVEQEEREAA